jgi:hypothetical protein
VSHGWGSTPRLTDRNETSTLPLCFAQLIEPRIWLCSDSLSSNELLEGNLIELLRVYFFLQQAACILLLDFFSLFDYDDGLDMLLRNVD